jgi:4-hydroxybenzoate polyprenyltransferase
MNQLKLFIDLTRLKKPIGYMLLFWPCVWGLTLAYDFSSNLENYFFYLLLFFLGAVLMRSAGCIVNDILDKEFDKRVLRTKNRPIASEKISIKVAIFYAGNPVFISTVCTFKFQSIYDHSCFRINAISLHLPFNEKIHLLASVIFRNYI